MPENTRLAIDSAIELGVDMVEIDIRVTKDGVPVLMHPSAVDHTTYGAGLVEYLTWDQILILDAGSWRGPQFAGEPVLSLSEALELCRGRVGLNLDLKTPAAVMPVVAATLEAGLTDDVVITGCGTECLRTVTSIAPGITTLFNPDGLGEGTDPPDAGAIARLSIDVAKELGAVGINLRQALVDADLITEAGEAGIAVWAYTVDDESRFGELIDMAATSLTTNWPERMLEVARERSSR